MSLFATARSGIVPTSSNLLGLFTFLPDRLRLLLGKDDDLTAALHITALRLSTVGCILKFLQLLFDFLRVLGIRVHRCLEQFRYLHMRLVVMIWHHVLVSTAMILITIGSAKEKHGR